MTLENKLYPGRSNYTGPNRGFFGFAHHDLLLEWSDNIIERVGWIKCKPRFEVSIRLHCLCYIADELLSDVPPEIIQECKQCYVQCRTFIRHTNFARSETWRHKQPYKDICAKYKSALLKLQENCDQSKILQLVPDALGMEQNWFSRGPENCTCQTAPAARSSRRKRRRNDNARRRVAVYEAGKRANAACRQWVVQAPVKASSALVARYFQTLPGRPDHRTNVRGISKGFRENGLGMEKELFGRQDLGNMYVTQRLGAGIYMIATNDVLN